MYWKFQMWILWGSCGVARVSTSPPTFASVSASKHKLQTSSHIPNHVSLILTCTTLVYLGRASIVPMVEVIAHVTFVFSEDWLPFQSVMSNSWPPMGLRRRPVTCLRDLGNSLDNLRLVKKTRMRYFSPLPQNNFLQIRRPGSQTLCPTTGHISGKSGDWNYRQGWTGDDQGGCLVVLIFSPLCVFKCLLKWGWIVSPQGCSPG